MDHKKNEVCSINSVASNSLAVPMCTTLAEEEARKSVLFRAPPDDEYKYHSFLTKLLVNHHDRSVLDRLVDEHLPNLKGGKTGKLLDELRTHLEQYLINLGRAQLCHKLLVVPEHKSHYTKATTILGQQGFQWANCHALNDYFTETGLVERLKGVKYDKASMAARVFPTERLAPELAVLALYSQQPFNGNYVRINKPEVSYESIIANLTSDHPDIRAMNTINEFMQSHTWALKAPIELVYSKDIMRGGRLYTPYQNLPSRKHHVRKNTLLDGKPLVEVDFSANHLRLALAIIAKEDAGETPYEDICELAGGEIKRQQAKDYFTRAIGSKDRTEALGACLKERINNHLFERLEAATQKRFPKLPLYDGERFNGGLGVYLQSIEGAILKDVMQLGMLNGIPTIPVHDAIAVQATEAEWAKDAMSEVWIEHVNCKSAKPRVA